MAKGKFSQPRTHRSEEQAATEAFRQVSTPKPVKKTYKPLDEEFFREDVPMEEPAFPEEQAFSEAPLQPQEPLYDEDYEPEEPAFLDKAIDFITQNRKVLLVSLCAVALVLIVGIIGIFFVTGASDPYDGKILNNVTIAGVNVGGMTRSEAISAVRAVTDQTFTKEDMVVELPDTTLRLSTGDTGAQLDVKSAVEAAFEYGRTGTEAEQQAAYNASLTGNHTIGLLPYLTLDEEYIRGVLEDYASQYGSTLTQTTYQLEGDRPALESDKIDKNAAGQTLVLTMGTPGVGFDMEALFEQILDAYSLNTFRVTMEDVDPEGIPDPVDLEAIYKEVCVEPVDATVDMQTYETIPGVYGYGFDMEAAQKLIDAAEYGEEVRIAMEYIEPEILDDEVFFQDVLGSCETPHSNNDNRTHNLKLACEALNGLVLKPGEEFSYNDALGERTADKGYKAAPAYSGNKLVDSLGGGICQVSSTLYYCTLLSDLEIVFRINHGFPVSYIDYGMDATVSWGYPDFKFKNNTNFPIKIVAEVSDGYVKMQILGTDERNYYVEMEYLITNIYKPETVYEEYEADNAEGYTDGQVLEDGTTGYFVKSYKLKYDKETGELISKDFEANSQYKTVDKVVVKILPKETEPEETTKPTEATKPTEDTKPTEPPKPTETTAPPTEPTAPPTESTPPTTEAPPPETEPAPTPTESAPPVSEASEPVGEGGEP